MEERKSFSIESVMAEGQLHAKISTYAQVIIQLYQKCAELEKKLAEKENSARTQD
jgi:uncharacterized membrane protein